MVGNGDRLHCNSYRFSIPICLGTIKFLVDLYILPISGAEVVLGIQSLKTLGSIVTDYGNLTMQLNWLSSNIHTI